MKLIIAGGRDYRLTHDDYSRLSQLLNEFSITEVVSGGAKGADSDGEFWASQNDIPVKRFIADWKAHGRAAGPIRNKRMAEYADAVALFPGGRGTESMHREATEARIRIFDFREEWV